MNREDTLKLLNKFVDPNRNNMDKPFSQELKIGKYLCATNGTTVILIPETEENKIENEVGYNPPNIDGIIPDFTDKINLKFNHLKKLFNEVPIIEQFITEECEACYGGGRFEHYGDWYECKNCDEKGQVKTRHIERIKDPKVVFSFKGTLIHISKINLILELQKNISIVKICKSIIWFKIDEIYIAICGVYEDNEYNIIDVL